MPYEEGIPEGEDLYATVQHMRNSTQGFDGWRVVELKLLGLAAWQQRARALKVQLETGKAPASYKQVTTPMLPKVKATEKIMEHRGLAVFSVLWRIESSIWYKKLSKWQDKWLPKGVHGARVGHECLNSAWPAQARIEMAMLNGEDSSAATLDCAKKSIVLIQISTPTC